MRHDATRQNATRKPCALTLRSRRAIRDSNEAPPALLAPEPVEPGRLKTLGRSWKNMLLRSAFFPVCDYLRLRYNSTPNLPSHNSLEFKDAVLCSPQLGKRSSTKIFGTSVS